MNILVVEDEFLVAAGIEAVLEDLGCTVVGPAPSVQTSLDLLDRDEPINGAIVDLNLRDQLSTPVADELVRRAVPFVLATGYEPHPDIQSRYPQVEWLKKPYTDQDISRLVRQWGEAK